MTNGGLKKSWPFPVYSGLLQNSHRKKIGEAIWEFLWCIDKTTLEEEGIGWVLGKKPVKIDEISLDLGESRSTVQRHLETLKRHHYITVIRARRGIVIGVLKSKKWPGKADLTPQSSPLTLKGLANAWRAFLSSAMTWCWVVLVISLAPFLIFSFVSNRGKP